MSATVRMVKGKKVREGQAPTHHPLRDVPFGHAPSAETLRADAERLDALLKERAK